MEGSWKRWWLWMWGVVSVALIVLAFFLPFAWWAGATVLAFGSMEAIGLLRKSDAYPPLTHVIRDYVPRELAMLTMYGFTGAAAATWLDFARPWAIGAVLAFVGWLTTHFDLAYDRRLGEELDRLKALGRAVLTPFRRLRRRRRDQKAGENLWRLRVTKSSRPDSKYRDRRRP